MVKSLAFAVCCAVLAATSQVNAADISGDTLAAMGLGDAVVVTDAESSAVRGMGYLPYKKGHKYPISIAAGGSFANVGGKKGEAGTVNGYLAIGKFSASGENFSEAGSTKTKSKVVDIDGVVKSVTTTKSIHVYAGGYSSSMSF